MFASVTVISQKKDVQKIIGSFEYYSVVNEQKVSHPTFFEYSKKSAETLQSELYTNLRYILLKNRSKLVDSISSKREEMPIKRLKQYTIHTVFYQYMRIATAPEYLDDILLFFLT